MKVCFMVSGGQGRSSFVKVSRQLKQFLQHPSFVVDVRSYNGLRQDKCGALFPLPSIAYDLLPPFLGWTNGYRFSKTLNKKDVDILHVFTPIYVHSSIPYIVSIDATGMQLFQLGYRRPHLFSLKHFPSSLYTKIVWSLEKAIYTKAEKIICFTQFARRGLIENYGVEKQKTCVIPPGVNLETFKPSTRKYSTNPVTLLFVGRDFVRKGGYILLKAFRRLKKKFSVRLKIIGTREHVALDGVYFAGDIGEEELVKSYKAADVFVLPTIAEAYGLVFLEAMASGLPIVTTSTTPRQEVVRGSALFVRTWDVDDLELKLAQLIKDIDLRIELGRRGRQIAETYHNWSNIAGQIEHVYKTCNACK